MLGRASSRVYWLFLCFIGFGFTANAQSNGKETIRLDSKIVSVEYAIALIKSQTDYLVSYPTQRLNLEKRILLRSKFYKLEDFVKAVFVDQNLRPVFKDNKKILLIFDPDNALRQVTRMISGIIIDQQDGEPLIAANIYDAYGFRGSYTNELGLFQLQIPASLDTVYVSYLGYDTKKVATNRLTKKNTKIKLKANLKLDEITIESLAGETKDIKEKGNHFINNRKFANSFTALGDNDPMAAVLKLPSVQSGREGDGSIYLRGGSPDQNLILMDGVPIYETTHVMGVASIFNDEAVKNVQLYKHAFPSKYGGRLSSVIEFQMNEGDIYNHKRSITVSPFNARLHLEGPINRGKTSYNLSFRTSLIDLFFEDALQSLLDFTDTDINYYDINAKISHQIAPGNKMFLNVYIGQDNVNLERTEILEEHQMAGDTSLANAKKRDMVNWGNRVVSLQWQKISNPQSYTKFNVFFANYSSDSRSIFEVSNAGDQNSTLDVLTNSSIQDAGANVEFNYFNDNDLRFSAGTGILYHNYRPILRQSQMLLGNEVDSLSSAQTDIRADEFFLYAEMQYHIQPTLLLQTGVRFSRYLVKDKSYGNIEPRLSLTKQFDNGRHSLSLSATKMNQYIHLLVNPGIGVPSDLWLPSTEQLPPEGSVQYSFSTNINVTKGIDFSFDGYYKKMTNVIEYTSPFDLFYTYLNDANAQDNLVTSGDWERFVETGSSTSRGVEFSIGKSVGKLQGLISYNLSKTDRTFDNINEGESFAYKFDRRHDLSVSASYNINSNWSLNTNWVYGTGDAYSVAVEQYVGLNGEILIQSEGRNNYRFPAFQRLDIGARYRRSIKNDKELRFDFGVYNVLNRKNPFYIYIFQNPLSDTFEQRQVSLFPILPHFNFYWRF